MLNNHDYKIGSIVKMIKPHPSKTKMWEIIRVGADIKIKSTTKLGLYIMFTRREFNKKVKKVVIY